LGKPIAERMQSASPVTDYQDIITLFGRRDPFCEQPAYEQRDPQRSPRISKRSVGRVLVYLSIPLLLLGGIPSTIHYWHNAYWPHAEATVIAGEFHETQQTCGGQPHVASYSCDEYRYRCTVSYLANGELREANIESPPFPRRASAQMWANHFSRGQRLVIIYAPLNPKFVQLVDTPSPGIDQFDIVKAALCLLVPGLLLILAARSEQAAPSDRS